MVSGRLDSSDQILVGKPPAGRAIDEAVQPQQGVPRDVSIIESERELVNVPTKVLRADMMIGAINAALQDSPNAFDAIRRRSVSRVSAA